MIDIIVPVYNAEKYITYCIESILNQTYQDYNLILVDDGSTDHSGEICDKYAAKDGRVLVIHKKNQGVSAARNSGIEVSQDNYMMFVDADDYLDDCLLQKLADHVCEKTELVACGVRYVWQDGKMKEFSLKNRRILNTEEFDENYIDLEDNLFFYSIYGKLYDGRIIRECEIRFPNKMSILEDRSFVLEYLNNISKIKTIEDCLYNYRQLPEMSLIKKYNKNAVWSSLEMISRGKGIEQVLQGGSKEHYNRVNYDIILSHIKKYILHEKDTKGLKKYRSQVMEICKKVQYESLGNIKFNIQLFLMRHGKYEELNILLTLLARK